MLRVESGNPVVKSVIKDEQLISERDQVEQAIAEYFQEIYSGEDRHMEAEADLLLLKRRERSAEANQGLFTDLDVMKPLRPRISTKVWDQMGLTGVYSSRVTPPTS